MILLDTHVLIWWTAGGRDLAPRHRGLIDEEEPDGVAASAFSIWEIATLVAKKRLKLDQPIDEWLVRITAIPTLHLLPATPQILIDSTRLPGDFHPDPADRIIVATARAHAVPLLSTDGKILAYPHVQAIGPR